jgi:regulator of cell morphogenesis and NO signaling
MLNPTLSVASLVLEHPGAARIFRKHRIDFCCQGQRSLEAACAARGVATQTVLSELERAAAPAGDLDPRALSTAELIDTIVERHHRYLREALPFVRALASKVARVHGDTNEHLRALDTLVTELSETLEPHLDEEEQKLFPALLARTPGVSELLAIMALEHERVGELIRQLPATADDYRVPEWACGSYRALFAELERLELDLLTHVHLENHVLRPRFTEGGSG